MRLLLTRPRAQSEALAEILSAQGHQVAIEPMLEIVPKDAAVELSGIAALVATSANGPRAFSCRSSRRDLPLFAVGDATAEAARRLGFATVLSASGDVDDLARLIGTQVSPEQGALLHLAGEDVAGDLTLALPGYDIRRVVLYEARAATELSPELRVRFGEIDAVLFFSPRSAAGFVTLLIAAGLTERAKSMIAFCLSQAVAQAAQRVTWQRVVVAARPDQASLLALIPAP